MIDIVERLNHSTALAAIDATTKEQKA